MQPQQRRISRESWFPMDSQDVPGALSDTRAPATKLSLRRFSNEYSYKYPSDEPSRASPLQAPQANVEASPQHTEPVTKAELRPRGISFDKSATPPILAVLHAPSLGREPVLPHAIERLAVEGPLRKPQAQSREESMVSGRVSAQLSRVTVSELHLDELGEYDDISQAAIYGHGCYQRMILVCSFLSLLVLRCHSLSFKIIARNVDYWCARPAIFQNLNITEWKSLALPPTSDGGYSRCEVYDNPLGQNRTPVPCTAWHYETDSQTIITTWDLVCNRKWLLTVAALMYVMGAVIAVPTLGMAADQIGRRPVTCIAVAILLVAGFGACFASSITVFICARCVVSGSTSSVFVTVFVLLFEVTSARYRTLYGIMTISLGVILSRILFSTLSEFDMDWRLTQIIIMGVTSVLVITFYVIEESPRWLLGCCNFKRAEKAVLWAAKMNGEPLDVVKRKFNKLKHAILLKEECVSPLALTPVFLFTCPLVRTRCFMILVCWFIVMFSFSGLGITNVVEPESRWAKFATAVIPVPLSVMIYYAINRLGRRNTLVLAFGFEGVACTALIVSYPSSLLVIANCILVTARAAAYIAVTVTYIYTVELFPTVLRSVGVCTAYFCGQVGVVAATILMSPHHVIPGQIGMAVLAFLALLAELTLQQLPETNSRPLINTIRQFEEADYKKFLQETLPVDIGKGSRLDGSKMSRTF
ncbi:solute carrier family 22 member 7-like [Ornithodoros turicata]|uniref:solute carrier family 22 member 7-like n=1 Tax=Ornithodoros turicata TaxID=34597 RepID=UPI003138E9D2